MGFSVSAASCIIGISFLIAVEIFSGTVFPLVSDVHEAYEEMTDRKVERDQTDIKIVNVTTTANGTGFYDYTISVENTGSITISLAKCNLLVNGTIVSFYTTTTYLFPEQSAELHVYHLSGSGLIRLKIITENDITAYYEFRI